MSKAAEGLKDIFQSKDFDQYLPFVGDARKLKRLINTIILLEVEKTDFYNSDFNKKDLIHLLLIYINYPNIFRKIYNTETQGKKGFFSLVTEYEDGYPKKIDQGEKKYYMNSMHYDEYLKTLTYSQQFIINKVFNVNERLIDPDGHRIKENDITQEMSSTYACFNGSFWSPGRRNLEQYINLITRAD